VDDDFPLRTTANPATLSGCRLAVQTQLFSLDTPGITPALRSRPRSSWPRPQRKTQSGLPVPERAGHRLRQRHPSDPSIGMAEIYNSYIYYL
jgi:hypothetical protein